MVLKFRYKEEVHTLLLADISSLVVGRVVLKLLHHMESTSYLLRKGWHNKVVGWFFHNFLGANCTWHLAASLSIHQGKVERVQYKQSVV